MEGLILMTGWGAGWWLFSRSRSSSLSSSTSSLDEYDPVPRVNGHGA